MSQLSEHNFYFFFPANFSHRTFIYWCGTGRLVLPLSSLLFGNFWREARCRRAPAGRRGRGSGTRPSPSGFWIPFLRWKSSSRTSEEVRDSFNELQVSFVNFNDKAEAAAVMDEQHRQRLLDGPRKGPSAERRHELAGEAALRHRWVSLPCEIHGEILLFLDLFDVDNLLCVGNQLRRALLIDEIWKPWCVQRWGISGVGGSWRGTCATRASALRPALSLCTQYKHYSNIHSNIGSVTCKSG